MVSCSVLGCKNRTEQKKENITFHSFPKDPILKTLWIDATGRQNWNPTKNTQHKLCSIHFDKECLQRKSKLTILQSGSIPKHFINETSDNIKETATDISLIDNISTETPDYINRTSSTCSKVPQTDKVVMETSDYTMEAASTSANAPYAKNIATIFEVPSDYTPRKRKLVLDLHRKSMLAEKRKKQIAVLKTRNWRLQKKNTDLTHILEHLKTRLLINQEHADLLAAIDPTKRDLLKRVLGVTVRKKYSPELRQFALTLHFISPRAYYFVRKTFDTCLPHPRTLTRWYQSVNGEPGFSKESFDAISMLSKNSEQPKLLGALCFDEMATRKCIEFDGNNYVGFVNCGNKLDNTELPVAKEALVFMLTCVNGSWKIPIGYFLIDGITAEQKAELVRQALNLVEQSGVNVVSLTFDGCPANFSMCKVLGCCLDKENIKSTFIHNNKEVAIFPDPSHMLKLIRNTLGEKKNIKR